MTAASTGQRRQQLYDLLGDLPDRERPITSRLISEASRQGFHVERLLLDLNGIEPVPAYFVRPSSGPGPYPVVLYNHSHGGDYGRGKEDPDGAASYLQPPPYAEVLSAPGIAVLCIDHWAFGERRGRTESELFKEHALARAGAVGHDGLR